MAKEKFVRSKPALLSTPNGQKISSYNNFIYVGQRKFSTTCGSQAGIDLTPTPKSPYKDNGDELYGNGLIYSAYFNFCPNSNNPLCSGTTSLVTVTSPQSVYTNANNNINGEVLLNGKSSTPQTVSFSPIYPDGSSVTNHLLFIKKADCTCVENNLANPTKVCVGGTFTCERCPSGYTFGNAYCGNNAGYVSNICYTGSQYSATNCIPQYSYKQACDGTHSITNNFGGQSTCAWWKTEIKCPTNQLCYLGNSGSSQGPGVGDCRCANNICNIGDVQIMNDSIHFQKCVNIGGCNGWDSGGNQCPTGLKITKDVNNKGSCVCDTTLSSYCDPNVNGKKCSNNLASQTCSSSVISDSNFGISKTCYNWANPTPCSGSSVCDSITGSCKCQNECTSKVCSPDGKGYYDCTIPTGDICKIQSTTKTTLSASQQCVNGQIIAANGCLPGYSTTCDSDHNCDALTSSSTYNTCVAKTTGVDSTSTPYCNIKNSTKQCKNSNTPQLCTLKSGTNDVYLWIEQPMCPTTNNVTSVCASGVCTGVGCAIQNAYTSQYACKNTTDSNQKLFEICDTNSASLTYNSCIPSKDVYFAGTNLTGSTHCIGNAIYTSQPFTGTSGIINRWCPTQTCGGNTPVCTEQ